MGRRNEWDPASITRFWNHFATRPGTVDMYFSTMLGAGVAELLSRSGVLHPGMSVLDYGCGPGYLASHLLAAGAEVRGIDSATESVAMANARLGDDPRWKGAVVSPHPPAPVDDASFDLVTCLETVEHLDDDALSAVLSDIARLLRPGGAVLVTTPNNEVLEDSFVYCPFCDSEFHAMQHVRSFDADSLRAALSGAGFDVELCRAVNLWVLVGGVSRFGAVPGNRPSQVVSTLAAAQRLARRARGHVMTLVGRDQLEPFLRPGDNLVALARVRRV
jgi:2-polyprenyl-3-methyl-5-hydroxy-6-metoxy-1,4-benzoquinol methylase